MRSLLLFLLTLFVFSCAGQQVSLVSKTPLPSGRLIDIDNFGNIYQLSDNELIKTTSSESINFSNVQLGNISTADAFNPLKINVFYENFNTVVILDNRLAEITVVNFNSIPPFRMVTHVSAGYDNTIWIFDQNTQQLELFDFLDLKMRVTTLPISENITDLKSNFNYCYVLTTTEVLIYNYFGNLIAKYPHPGFSEFEENNGELLFRKENELFIYDQKTGDFKALELPELLISRFFVTDETLYIYDGEILHQFQLKAN